MEAMAGCWQKVPIAELILSPGGRPPDPARSGNATPFIVRDSGEFLQMKQRAGVIGRDVLRGVWCDANVPQAPMITGDLQRAAWPSPFRPALAPILFGCQGLGQTFSFAHGTRKMKGYALTIRLN